MSILPRVCVSATFLAVVALLAGCGGGNLPELGTVTGKVTLDGKPLADALVVFELENSSPSEGTTDAQGNYELNYKPGVSGAALGKHVVRISKFEGDDEEEGAAAVTEEQLENLIPAAYNQRSKLTAEVKAGSQVIDFPLSSTEEDGEEGDEEEEAAAAGPEE